MGTVLGAKPVQGRKKHRGVILNSRDLLQLTPVLPVVAIADPAWAVPLAKALKCGGIGVIEVVLRTPVSLQAIQAIKEQVPEVIVGAGTVLNEDLSLIHI